ERVLNQVREAAPVLHDGCNPDLSRQLDQPPRQKPVREVCRQISKLVRAQNGHWKCAQKVRKIIEIAAALTADVGEQQLPLFARPPAQRGLELPVTATARP